MNDEQARSIVAMVEAFWPQFRPNEMARAMWVTSLKKHPFSPVMLAVERISETSEEGFAPALGAILREATATGDRSGEEAYAELMVAVRRFGRTYGPGSGPKFSDPLLTQAVGLWGSWNGFCDSPEDDPGGRARFIELYDSLAKRERRTAQTTPGLQLPAPQGANVVNLLQSVGKVIK